MFYKSMLEHQARESISKSLAITFGKGISENLKSKLIQLLGISKVGGFGRYLGLPEAVGRNKYDTFSFIQQRVMQKLESWYTKFLSPAGKEILIKVVATSLPTYCMSCFLLPNKLIDRITSAIRNFWWSAAQDRRRIPWVAWSKITKTKREGGLGIRDIKDFNIALLAKQSWRILQNPHSLLARIYKAKYFSKTALLEAKKGHRPSHAWKSIIQGNSLISRGIKWIVGDGKTIRVGKIIGFL